VLGLLTDQARKGSVTASVALERLLRHGPPAPIDDVLERCCPTRSEMPTGNGPMTDAEIVDILAAPALTSPTPVRIWMRSGRWLRSSRAASAAS
jgi:hypothetical protein